MTIFCLCTAKKAMLFVLFFLTERTVLIRNTLNQAENNN